MVYLVASREARDQVNIITVDLAVAVVDTLVSSSSKLIRDPEWGWGR